MSSESTFRGWKLQAWNLEFKTLELQFGLFPNDNTTTDDDDGGTESADTRLNGKAIFSGVKDVIFSHCRAYTTVVGVAVSSVEGSDAATYRFDLEDGGYVAVHARECTEVLW